MTWLDRVPTASTGTEPVTRREQVIAVFEGLSLSVASALAGILAALGISIAVNSTSIPPTDAVQLLQTRAIQVGFLGLALIYLAVCPQRRREIHFEISSLHGVAWIIAIPLLAVSSGYVLEPRAEIEAEMVDGRPVIPLQDTVAFANEYYATFESALDMLGRMYDDFDTDANYRREPA